MSMTELNEYDYQNYHGSYEAYEIHRNSIVYRTMIKIGNRNMFHTEFADSAIEAWINLLEQGYTPVYVKPKDHD